MDTTTILSLLPILNLLLPVLAYIQLQREKVLSHRLENIEQKIVHVEAKQGIVNKQFNNEIKGLKRHSVVAINGSKRE